MSGLFVNVEGVTYQMTIVVHDSGENGEVVWKITLDGEDRFVEGFFAEDIWDVVDRAVHAYDE